jgi:L-threonylcarbamoyladenylate synthase
MKAERRQVETAILPADHPEALDRAVHVLEAGGLVAFPTDTVYGIGAHAFRSEAVLQLYRAKRRPLSKAIPLLLADAADAELVGSGLPPLFERLASAFWPGPLTLVVSASRSLPRAVTAGGESVALRVPDHPVARTLIAALGTPLAATSANLSGQPSPVTAEQVQAQLDGRVDLILDGGPCPGGIPSTLLDLTVQPASVLRPGPIARASLMAVWEARESEKEVTGQAMRIAVGSDHAGFELKSAIAEWLVAQGYVVADKGTESASVRVDYPDISRSVAQDVADGECQRGIVVCGTGIGVSMMANKVAGVRAALCTNVYMARMSRQHNDANVLCLGERVLGSGLALDIVAAWLEASFEGGRHARRVAKMMP